MNLIVTCYHIPQAGRGETRVLTFEAKDVADLRARVEQFYEGRNFGRAHVLIITPYGEYMLYQPHDPANAEIVAINPHATVYKFADWCAKWTELESSAK